MISDTIKSNILNKKYDREKRIYEFFQIRLFQKMVFMLERMIHKKDGGNNINYHFATENQNFGESFIKYLFFNGIIHIRNLLFFSVYFFVKGLFARYSLFDILFLVLAIKDLYCVMLQRYNYLRIAIFHGRMKERKQKLINKQVAIYKEKMKSKYDTKFRENDLMLIKRLKEGLESSEYILLDDNDYLALKRIIRIVEND